MSGHVWLFLYFLCWNPGPQCGEHRRSRWGKGKEFSERDAGDFQQIAGWATVQGKTETRYLILDTFHWKEDRFYAISSMATTATTCNYWRLSLFFLGSCTCGKSLRRIAAVQVPWKKRRLAWAQKWFGVPWFALWAGEPLGYDSGRRIKVVMAPKKSWHQTLNPWTLCSTIACMSIVVKAPMLANDAGWFYNPIRMCPLCALFFVDVMCFWIWWLRSYSVFLLQVPKQWMGLSMCVSTECYKIQRSLHTFFQSPCCRMKPML